MWQAILSILAEFSLLSHTMHCRAEVLPAATKNLHFHKVGTCPFPVFTFPFILPWPGLWHASRFSVHHTCRMWRTLSGFRFILRAISEKGCPIYHWVITCRHWSRSTDKASLLLFDADISLGSIFSFSWIFSAWSCPRTLVDAALASKVHCEPVNADKISKKLQLNRQRHWLFEHRKAVVNRKINIL